MQREMSKRIKTTHNAHETWMRMTCAKDLEPMSRATLLKCRETRENVTCEGVLKKPSVPVHDVFRCVRFGFN